MSFIRNNLLLPLVVCMTLAIISLSSCHFSQEEKRQIAQSQKGKEFFRDSKKWGKVVTQTLSLREFSLIEMDGNIDINLIQSEETKIEVMGNEKAIALHSIEVVKKGGKDVLLLKKAKKDYLRQVPSIKLRIAMPHLEGIEVNGEGDLEIKDDAFFMGNLDIVINGEGEVEARDISCDSLRVVINGEGDMKAKKLNCTATSILINGDGGINADIKAHNINLQLGGNGEAELDVKCEMLYVSAGGNSEVKLKGRCVNLFKQVVGKASLDSRRLHVSGDIKLQ